MDKISDELKEVIKKWSERGVKLVDSSAIALNEPMTEEERKELNSDLTKIKINKF